MKVEHAWRLDHSNPDDPSLPTLRTIDPRSRLMLYLPWGPRRAPLALSGIFYLIAECISSGDWNHSNLFGSWDEPGPDCGDEFGRTVAGERDGFFICCICFIISGPPVSERMSGSGSSMPRSASLVESRASLPVLNASPNLATSTHPFPLNPLNPRTSRSRTARCVGRVNRPPSTGGTRASPRCRTSPIYNSFEDIDFQRTTISTRHLVRLILEQHARRPDDSFPVKRCRSISRHILSDPASSRLVSGSFEVTYPQSGGRGYQHCARA